MIDFGERECWLSEGGLFKSKRESLMDKIKNTDFKKLFSKDEDDRKYETEWYLARD